MKKILFTIIVIGFLASCKNEKTPTADLTNQATSVTKGKAERDGNVIRQKVTVGGNQNQNMNIDAMTALKMINDNPKTIVLDVRTDGEVADGIYKNAMHIDYNGADFKTKINKLDKKDTYIVYCKSGGRSGKAVNMMRAFGFQNSYNMKEGYSGLVKASKN